MKRSKKIVFFIKNQDAVLGLPMRLTVCVIIGMAALLAILSLILNPCLFLEKMSVSVVPLVTTISGNESENVTFMVTVHSINGHAISGASVIVKGLGGAGCGFSDKNGNVSIILQVHMKNGVSEGYLDLSVSAPCYESFDHEDMIKIVKVSPL